MMHHQAATITLEKGASRFKPDPRFELAWSLTQSSNAERPLLIAVHGSFRDHEYTRDVFDDLACRNDINVLAPLFPVGVGAPDYGDGYKFLREPGIDYAALLEDMIAQFTAQHQLTPQRVYLFGFSGGAQFALRYAYVAAHRLAGVGIAAPGTVTLLDPDVPWWPGIGDVERVLGRAIDQNAFKKLPIHLVMGREDHDEGLVVREPGHPNYSKFADIAGVNRLARLEALKESFDRAGMNPGFEVLDGVGHELGPVAGAAAIAIEQWLKS